MNATKKAIVNKKRIVRHAHRREVDEHEIEWRPTAAAIREIRHAASLVQKIKGNIDRLRRYFAGAH